jgi:ligand-binding sensor domain-containing protein
MKKLLSLAAFISVRSIYCAVIIISFSFYTRAQEMSARVYTVKDGLPSANVIRACQDKFGYLWLSTSEGACRFDGKSFSSNGLSDGQSAVVFVDSHLRYWAQIPTGMLSIRGTK